MAAGLIDLAVRFYILFESPFQRLNANLDCDKDFHDVIISFHESVKVDFHELGESDWHDTPSLDN